MVPIAHIENDFPTKFGIPRQSGRCLLYTSFTAIRNIAITVGVTNLTVGGCVIAGKIKNIVFKQRGGKLL